MILTVTIVLGVGELIIHMGEYISKVGGYILSPPYFLRGVGRVFVFKTQKGAQDIKMRRLVEAEGTSEINRGGEGGLKSLYPLFFS